MIKKISLMFLIMAVLGASIVLHAQQAPAPGAAGGQRGPGGPAGAGGPGGAGAGGRGGAAQNNTQAIVPIKPGLYMVTGAGANTMVRVTNDGILVVDTKNRGEANYKALMEQIRTVSDKPIKFAVVSDVHQDKSGNTEFFTAAGVQVIAHVNEKKGLETYTNAAGTPGPPNVTYDKDYSIKLGTAEVARVYHFASGATNGDSIVYFPDLKVVTMGDQFQNGINCDYPQGGSLLEWPKSLEAVLKLDIDTVIPNRGDPATKADLQVVQKRLAGIAAAALAEGRKGTPKDQILAAINAVDPSFQVNALLQNNQTRIDMFFDEVTKAAK